MFFEESPEDKKSLQPREKTRFTGSVVMFRMEHLDGRGGPDSDCENCQFSQGDRFMIYKYQLLGMFVVEI
jgi:hypothetical protein